MGIERRRKKYTAHALTPFCAALIIGFAVLLVRGFIASGRESITDIGSNEYEDIKIEVFLHREDRIAEMDMEEYIMGVVAAEMPASFSDEALKAQAVAARTYTVRRIEELGGSACKKGRGDICTDSSCCQAYRSEEELYKSWGGSFSENREKLKAAVLSTRGEIITYNGEAIEALYHSNAGGMTEAAVNVFSNARPYLQSVESPDSTAAHGLTKVYFTYGEFADGINSEYEDADVDADALAENIEIISRYEGGRIEKMRLGNAYASGKEIRKLFDLESANFELDFSDGSVCVKVHGYGHGVGMSQYGADAMAKEGKTYREILAHYYRDTKISGI